MKSGSRAGSGSVVPSTTSASTTVNITSSMAEKHPRVDERESLKKRGKKATPEQPADASGSTTRAPTEKGKRSMEIEDAPERGYTIRDLCEVEDLAGADKYFASIMTQLKTAEGEDPLVPRWSAISGLPQVWTVGPLAGEYLRGALHPVLAKQGLHFISALSYQVHDAGRPVMTLLKAELKAKGSKAVATYKASQGFELGLEKMGRVSYEFGYRVTLERLRGKHPEIEIEQDPFAECSEDTSVGIDLN
ncbi:hypothetical protein GW17_00052635 [Ensete ventricosum]|nr:hypothetical protein GW17_00052635 [Ensete ventricosum]